MNYRSFVFVFCLMAYAGASFAQTPNATFRNGLIQVQGTQWQDEWVIDLQGSGITNLQGAFSAFDKYINTFGPYATFSFDFSKNVAYMRVQRQSASLEPLTPASLNNVLRIIYTR